MELDQCFTTIVSYLSNNDGAIMALLTLFMGWNIYLQRTQGAHLQQAKPRLEFYDFTLSCLRNVDKLRANPNELSMPWQELKDEIRRAKTLAFVAFLDDNRRSHINNHLDKMEELFQIIERERSGDRLFMELLLESQTGKTAVFNRIVELFKENEVFTKDLPALCTQEDTLKRKFARFFNKYRKKLAQLKFSYKTENQGRT